MGIYQKWRAPLTAAGQSREDPRGQWRRTIDGTEELLTIAPDSLPEVDAKRARIITDVYEFRTKIG